MSNAFPQLHGKRLHSLHPGPHHQFTTSPSTSSAGAQRAGAKLRPPSCPGYHPQTMEFSPTEILNCKPDNYYCSVAQNSWNFLLCYYLQFISAVITVSWWHRTRI